MLFAGGPGFFGTRGERVGLADAPAVSHRAHDRSGQMHLSHLWDRCIWPLCCSTALAKSSTHLLATSLHPSQANLRANPGNSFPSTLPHCSGDEKLPSAQGWSGKTNMHEEEAPKASSGVGALYGGEERVVEIFV